MWAAPASVRRPVLLARGARAANAFRNNCIVKGSRSGRIHVNTMMRVRVCRHQAVGLHEANLGAELCFDFWSGHLKTKQLFGERSARIKFTRLVYEGGGLLFGKNRRPLCQVQMNTNAQLRGILCARTGISGCALID